MRRILFIWVLLLLAARPMPQVSVQAMPVRPPVDVQASAPKGDFRVKAFHLDMRIQVMTMPALRAFVQMLHEGGINTLIMEYEGTYPYGKHPLIPNEYAYSRAEILSFVAFCNQLGVDVIPLQQSFGHVEYILRHSRYRSLREDSKDLSQVCPLKITEDSLLFTDLYTELASTHTSPYIHIGCDETHLLGHCPECRRKVEKEGVSKLYFDYVRMLCNIVVRLGKRPVLWADMALKYPEAIKSLPKGTVFVDWNYGWRMDRFGDHQKLLASGYEIWGAPAIRSSPDNDYLTEWEKHLDNIRDFVPQARQMGYQGIVLTSWSTSGTYSYVYESENDLSSLDAIRRVYPITGFHLLIAAYMESLRTTGPLDVNRFINQYGKSRLGFDSTESRIFWQALKTAPYEVKEGSVESPMPITLQALADSGAAAAQALRMLHPVQNEKEFEHYRLMADIRAQHLRFLEIVQEANTQDFNRDSIPGVLHRLQTLIAENTGLSQRFIDLNRDDFYLPELEEENRLRSVTLVDFYNRLNRFGR
jgi:hexosaminidase